MSLTNQKNIPWWRFAACRGKGPDLFFAGDDWSNIEAKMICDECPEAVHRRCLDAALEEDLSLGEAQDGIRAHLGPEERKNLLYLIEELNCTGTVGHDEE